MSPVPDGSRAAGIGFALIATFVVVAMSLSAIGALPDAGRVLVDAVERQLAGPALSRELRSPQIGDESIGVAEPARPIVVDRAVGRVDLEALAAGPETADSTAAEGAGKPDVGPAASSRSWLASPGGSTALAAESSRGAILASTTTSTLPPTTTSEPPITHAPTPSSTAAPTSTPPIRVIPTPTTTVAPTTTTTTTTTAAPTTTTAAPAPSVAHVSTSGMVRGGGLDGLRIADALRRASPGTQFAFDAGTHGPLEVVGVHGASGAPITLRAADPNNPPVFRDTDITTSAGVEISDSSHIVVRNVSVNHALWGIRIERSTGVTVTGAGIEHIGQEGVRVVDRSSWIVIEGSTIRHTGQRQGTAPDGQSYATFGEGIYVGTGSGTSNDVVREVIIRGNTISHTGTEAIDVKAPSRGISILNNTIRNIDTRTSGAVVVHLSTKHAVSDADIEIRGNSIRHITSSSGHRDGVGVVLGTSANVRNNTITHTAHYGVRIEDDRSNGSELRISVTDNVFQSIGLDPIWSAAERARLTVSGNSTG